MVEASTPMRLGPASPRRRFETLERGERAIALAIDIAADHLR